MKYEGIAQSVALEESIDVTPCKKTPSDEPIDHTSDQPGTYLRAGALFACTALSTLLLSQAVVSNPVCFVALDETATIETTAPPNMSENHEKAAAVSRVLFVTSAQDESDDPDPDYGF